MLTGSYEEVRGVSSRARRGMAGVRVLTATGRRVGRVRGVVPAEGGDGETWLVVSTGVLGLHETVVPLSLCRVGRGGLRLPCERDGLAVAPRGRGMASLSRATTTALQEHYHCEPPARAA